jgi:alpha-D-ribose 1-methylphosphonate 5-triphosphate diphosphatase
MEESSMKVSLQMFLRKKDFAMIDYALHNVVVVTPEALIPNASVVVEQGVIAYMGSGPETRFVGSLDGGGSYLLPGLIDVHSDGLEKELSPRPGVVFPEAFGLRSFEGRLHGAGVTTAMHGVGYEHDDRHERTVELAERLTIALRVRRADPGALVDHRILYRVDARDLDGVSALEAHLDSLGRTESAAFVSFEDHTPGQGQYSNVDHYRRWLRSRTDNVDEELQRVIDKRAAKLENRDPNLARLCRLAQDGRINMLVHDPVTADDIDTAAAWPASIAEFPTTVEAAHAAIELGMSTVLGAPNVMRGGSHSGNVSAEELVRKNLVTCLASDYQPATLLAAVFLLAQRGACSLPSAVRLVTEGPAKMLGLADRGRIEVGRRADLVLCDFDGSWPTIRQTWRAPSAIARSEPQIPALLGAAGA